jgi:hypothetical protein
MAEEIIEILTEEIDEATLSKMPLWFIKLRQNYRRNNSQ